MVVAKITEAKALELKDLEYKGGVKYNPIQDINNNWVISLAELEHSFDLVSVIELIEFVPKIEEVRAENTENLI